MLKRAPSMKRTLVKAAAVGLLAVLAVRMNAPDLLAAALAFSALGDAALAVEGAPEAGDRPFLFGLAAFLAAHLAYAVLFWPAGSGLQGPEWVAAAVIVLTALAYGALLFRKAGALALPVAVYVAAIAMMGVSAASIGGTVLAGALLFIASDAILGAERFLISPESPARRITAPAVWVLYWLGQAVIAVTVIRLST
jgi:uncharacterized membrane protein YhhN